MKTTLWLFVLVTIGLSFSQTVEGHGAAKRGINLPIGKTCEQYVNCCSLMPRINALKDEANQLGQSVSTCQAKLQEAVDLLNNKTGGNFVLDNERRKRDLDVSISTAPFEFDLNVDLEFLTDLLGWLIVSLVSPQEIEKCKACCQTMKQLPDLLAYVQELHSASDICEQHLNDLQAHVDEILSPHDCPQGFYYSSTTNRCFTVVVNASTYDEGQALCGGVGGVLASIRYQSEQTAIEEIIKSIPVDTSQCSCNRGGACFTTSGQTLDPNACGTGNGRLVWKPKPGYYMEIGYTNWKAGEPNCYGGNEHCIVLDAFFDYVWNDYPCNTKTCPICEADPH